MQLVDKIKRMKCRSTSFSKIYASSNQMKPKQMYGPNAIRSFEVLSLNTSKAIDINAPDKNVTMKNGNNNAFPNKNPSPNTNLTSPIPRFPPVKIAIRKKSTNAIIPPNKKFSQEPPVCVM